MGASRTQAISNRDVRRAAHSAVVHPTPDLPFLLYVRTLPSLGTHARDILSLICPCEKMAMYPLSGQRTFCYKLSLCN